LSAARLRGATCKNAIFFGCGLSNLNLTKISLKWADLRNTIFYKANLTDAKLNGATMNKADLREASLGKADLSEANFEGVEIEGASFQKAVLYGVINLTEDQIRTAKTFFGAQMDPELLAIVKKYPRLLEPPQDEETEFEAPVSEEFEDEYLEDEDTEAEAPGINLPGEAT
jgi:hypothetical protein